MLLHFNLVAEKWSGNNLFATFVSGLDLVLVFFLLFLHRFLNFNLRIPGIFFFIKSMFYVHTYTVFIEIILR